MTRYTLNRRGRILWNYIPLTLLAVAVLTTNLVEFAGYWIRTGILELVSTVWP